MRLFYIYSGVGYVYHKKKKNKRLAISRNSKTILAHVSFGFVNGFFGNGVLFCVFPAFRTGTVGHVCRPAATNTRTGSVDYRYRCRSRSGIIKGKWEFGGGRLGVKKYICKRRRTSWALEPT